MRKIKRRYETNYSSKIYEDERENTIYAIYKR